MKDGSEDVLIYETSGRFVKFDHDVAWMEIRVHKVV